MVYVIVKKVNICAYAYRQALGNDGTRFVRLFMAIRMSEIELSMLRFA